MSQLQHQLQLQPNFNEPGKRYFRDFTPGDDFYEALIDTHRDLTDEQSALVNAKLILFGAACLGKVVSYVGTGCKIVEEEEPKIWINRKPTVVFAGLQAQTTAHQKRAFFGLRCAMQGNQQCYTSKQLFHKWGFSLEMNRKIKVRWVLLQILD
jgi:hypothetical protein